MKVRLEAEAPEDFERGNCHDCPFCYDDWYNDGDGWWEMYEKCILGRPYDKRPIQIIGEESKD